MPDLVVDDGVRLHYEVRAGDRGPPVVLLHGALAASAAFRGQLPLLAELGRPAVTLDLRGHARSAHVPEAPAESLHVPRMAADVAKLADALAPGVAVDLVGVSLGGLVGAYLAATRPPRVRRLALLSTPSRARPERQAFFEGTRPEDLPPRTQRLAATWHGEPYWRDLARSLFPHLARPPQALLEARPRPERALVVQAEHDELLAPDEAASWVARIDAPTDVVTAPGDHAFFADGREGTRAVNAALRRFLG